MYADQPTVLELVALLEAYSIERVVLCPGSRNAPLVHSLSCCPSMRCHEMTDERSAGFYALGMALATGRPVAVCCTSGSALVNLHPAVVEAYYQRVPLIVISADRPEAWIGQMDGQTMPQRGVFGSMVRRSVSLPQGSSQEELWFANRLINEALLEALGQTPGPVHINVPLAEPLFSFTAPELPQVRRIHRLEPHSHDCWGAYDQAQRLVQQVVSTAERILVVVGQLTEQEKELKPLVERLLPQAVWLTEHLSSREATQEAWLTNFDALLSAIPPELEPSLAPDLIITLGGHLVSKRLKLLLRRHRPSHHWHYAPEAIVADLFGCQTLALGGSLQDLESWLEPRDKSYSPATLAYRDLWQRLSTKLPAPHLPYSAMRAVGDLLAQMPRGSILHLGNSSAVRHAQLYPLPPQTRVCCNRGINGIEGSLSAALGYAHSSDRLNFVILGDLSFFYDMNALWGGQISSRLRLLLLNNGGGGIFRSLPGLNPELPSFGAIMGSHTQTAEAWAKACHLSYRAVHNALELEEQLKALCDPNYPEPILVEVQTSMDEDARLLQDYYHQLKAYYYG